MRRLSSAKAKFLRTEHTPQMEFRIAETFQKSLENLTNQEQKIVKAKAFDIQLNISGNSNQFHRLDRAKDNNFWSVRVNSDIRIIAHKSGKSVMLTYVDHHDDAYKWAANRVIRKHPKTGAAQIIEVKESSKDTNIWGTSSATLAPDKLFAELDEEQLAAIGVPEEFVFHVQTCDESMFFELTEKLPAEASEKLIEYAAGGISGDDLVLPTPTSQDIELEDELGLNHPDAIRRFALVSDEAGLHAALDFPWHKWTVFLHPEQKKFTELSYNGSARVSGSAGTGKTIVALHRAAYLHKQDPTKKILLCTFTKTLAAALQQKLEILLAKDALALDKIDVFHLEGLASAHLKRNGQNPNIVSKTQLVNFLKRSAQSAEVTDYENGFLLSEWDNVIDDWGIETLQEYTDLSRLGRKSKLGINQRKDLWLIFEETKLLLKKRKLTTWSRIFRELNLAHDKVAQYDHVIVDEAQDISSAELSFLARHYGKKSNGLFFAGDIGQRIFRAPFSWSSLGVDVRGKSNILKVNYRTSQQIRAQADLLLPKKIKDGDNQAEDRSGTISIFRGELPRIILNDDEVSEAQIVSDWIEKQISEGIAPTEIGVFVRTEHQYKRALNAIKKSGNTGVVLNYKLDGDDSSINYGTMHLAKGLEFRSVAVIACDQDALPLHERMRLFTEKADIEEIERTERQLLYVACTRARESLLVTGVGAGSKYLYDLA